MRAYNGLRLIGPLGRLGAFSPVRHPAKRRHIKTVLQDIMYRAAPFIRKARRRVLNFGRQCPAFRAFVDVQEYVLEAGPSP